MQDLIKRHFWVIGAVTVMICCVFVAKATNHVLDGVLLPYAEKAPHIPVVTVSPATPAKQVRTKDGTLLASRNMFCSECTPAIAVVNADPSAIQTTTLPLILLATNVAAKGDESYATIINTENQHQGSFGIGDKVPGATGGVKEIHYKYVDFENNGHIERVVLQGASAPPPPVVAEAKPEGDGNDLQAAIDSGVKSTGENQYEIDRALVDKVLANPAGVIKGARVVPSTAGGKANGFKVYAIRPESVFAKLGLTNGDTLSSINGIELTSIDQAMQAYQKLRDSTHLELEVQRRGKPMTLKYSIR
jgi:general secretion pathway protein C